MSTLSDTHSPGVTSVDAGKCPRSSIYTVSRQGPCIQVRPVSDFIVNSVRRPGRLAQQSLPAADRSAMSSTHMASTLRQGKLEIPSIKSGIKLSRSQLLKDAITLHMRLNFGNKHDNQGITKYIGIASMLACYRETGSYVLQESRISLSWQLPRGQTLHRQLSCAPVMLWKFLEMTCRFLDESLWDFLRSQNLYKWWNIERTR